MSRTGRILPAKQEHVFSSSIGPGSSAMHCAHEYRELAPVQLKVPSSCRPQLHSTPMLGIDTGVCMQGLGKKGPNVLCACMHACVHSVEHARHWERKEALVSCSKHIKEFFWPGASSLTIRELMDMRGLLKKG